MDIPALASAEFARGDWLKVPTSVPFLQCLKFDLQELSIGGMMKMRASLFKSVSAGEILFDGFSDPLLTVGSLFAKPGQSIDYRKYFNLNIVGGIPMDKFGWFYARNGTTWSDGVVTMSPRTDDIAKLGDIRQVT